MLVYYFSNLVSNDFNVFDKIKKFFKMLVIFLRFFRVFLFSFPVLLNNNPQQQYGSVTK